MNTYIALLRGINVVGKNLLPMRELVALLEALGSRNVTTLIQSGNAVFQHGEDDVSLLKHGIGAEIRQRCGFAPCVLLLRPEELERSMAGNPFRDAEPQPDTLHLGFLASAPLNPDLKALEGVRKESERFLLQGRVFYLHAPEGIGRSKLAARAEKLLGVAMTDRNWRTVCKINEMVKKLQQH